MAKYRIGVWEEQGGYLIVEAKSKGQAIKKAQEHIDDYGFDDKVDGTHRSTDVFTGDIKIIK